MLPEAESQPPLLLPSQWRASLLELTAVWWLPAVSATPQGTLDAAEQKLLKHYRSTAQLEPAAVEQLLAWLRQAVVPASA